MVNNYINNLKMKNCHTFKEFAISLVFKNFIYTTKVYILIIISNIFTH